MPDPVTPAAFDPYGGVAPATDPVVSSHREQMVDKMTAARQAGATWDQVHASMDKLVETARAKGATDAQIASSMGYNNPGELIAGMQEATAQHIAATKPPDFWEAALGGLTHSSGAALLGIKPQHDIVPGTSLPATVVSAVTETIGDLPVAIPAGMFGAARGAAIGGAIPGLGETGVPEAAGAVAGAMSAGGAPQLIKSERDRYISALNSGQVKGPADFLRLQGQVAQDTAGAAVVAGATGAAGKFVSGLVDKVGVSSLTKIAATGATEVGVMATGSAALQGRMPTIEDFIDGAVLVGAFHGVRATPAVLRTIRTRMQQVYVDTGKTPTEQAQEARTDPTFRGQLLGLPEPKPPAGSSTTPVEPAVTPQRGTLQGPHTPVHPNTPMVVPRSVGSFDQAVEFTLQHEGGAQVTDANNAQVKWGINAKDHPGVDVSGLSRDDAKAIYHEQYWKAIGGDSLPDNMKLAAFDTAVVEGVTRAKQWLAESEGDPQKFLARRAAFEAELAAKDPERYGRFVKAWGNRIRDLGGGEGIAGLASRDPSQPFSDNERSLMDSLDKEVAPSDDMEEGPGKDLALAREDFLGDRSNEQRALGIIGSDSEQNLYSGGAGGSGGGSGRNGGGGGGTPGAPSDRAAWDNVSGIEGRPQDPDWVDKVSGTLKDIYLEMFDPDHPIRQMTNARVEGAPLDDARNPLFLRRLLETSDTSAAYAIDRRMITLDGRVTETPALRDIMYPKQKSTAARRQDFKDFLTYSKAVWAGEKGLEGKETGVDLKDATKVILEGRDRFEERRKQLMDWQNQTLGWLYQGELASREQVDKWVEFNQARIPGYRIMDDEKPSVGAKGADNFNPVKAFVGSEKQLQPVYASLQKDAYLRMQLAKSNLANLAIFDRAADLGEARERPISGKFDALNILQSLKDEGIDDDVLSGVAKALFKSGTLKKDEVPIWRDGKMFAAQFDDPDVVRTLRGYNTFTIGTLGKIAAAPTNFMRKAIVLNPVFPLKIASYDLQFQTIINPDGRAAVLQFVSGMGKTLTGMAQAGDMGGQMKALGSKLPETPEWDRWLRSGGAEKVFDTMSRDKSIQARLSEVNDPHGMAGAYASGIWNAIKTPTDALSAFGRTISQFQRVGRFAAGINKGESDTRAAVASQDAAFHRPGFGGPVSRGLNQLIPFLTAHLNGLEKTTRALLGGAIPDNKTALGTPYKASHTWLLGAALVTAPTLLQWYNDKDKDWYRAIPAWQRGLGLWFHTGGDPAKGQGVTTCIPYPPLVSLIFGEIPRRFAEQFIGDNPHAWDGFWKSAGMSLTPPGTETGVSILQPILEGTSNHSFLKDAPLVDDDMRKHVGAAEQYTPYTSGAAKAVAQFADDMPLTHANLGWSPIIVDNYIKEWSGGWGDKANAVAMEMNRSGAKNPPPAWGADDWFATLLGSVASRYPNASSAPVNQFYDTSTKLDQAFGSIKQAVRADDFDRFKALVDAAGPSAASYHQLRLEQEIPPGVDIGKYEDYLGQQADRADAQDMDLVQQAQVAMKQAHAFARSVYENPDYSANDKRQLLDSTAMMMMQISERANEAFDRARVGVKNPGASAKAPVPDSIDFNPPTLAQ